MLIALALVNAVVPDNIVQAAANTKMLGLVLFSILFGFFLAGIPQPHQGMDKIVKNPRVFAAF